VEVGKMSRYYESPNFLVEIVSGLIGSRSFDLIEIKPESEKYLNMNGMTIDNLSSNSIKLYLNQDLSNPYFIAPNTSRSFENISFQSFKVENVDAVATDKNIYISSYRSVSIIQILKAMGKRQGLFIYNEDYINGFGVLK